MESIEEAREGRIRKPGPPAVADQDGTRQEDPPAYTCDEGYACHGFFFGSCALDVMCLSETCGSGFTCGSHQCGCYNNPQY